jgi:cytochrome c biogenesis protein CcmG/thiol:disulfide interchange protein DsbE
MKTLQLTTFLLLTALFSHAQSEWKVPSATIKTLDGKKINTSQFSNDGKPMIINFWATWCAPCKRELSNIAEVYEEWQFETGVKD